VGTSQLLVILAVVVATGIALFAVTHTLLQRPQASFEQAYELKKALLAGRLSGVTVSVEARPMTINITLDGVNYAVKASRVLVAYRAGSPVFEEATPEPWRVWGNGTHAGAVSYLGIADDGVTVTVTYYSATPATNVPSICAASAGQVAYSLQARSSGTIAFYSFKGPRKVVVEEVRVGPCQQ
jgi:hypothetical protein